MNSKIEKVTIAGGGTAGWMTATYLNKVFGKSLDITLVESPNISTVGVGEATFSTIKLFFDFLGLKEEEWMGPCKGSYKLGIKFVDWNKEKKHFYHPFQRLDVVDGFNMGEWWLKHKDSLGQYDYSCFITSALCDHKRSPRFFDGKVYDSKVDKYIRSDNEGNKDTLAELAIQFPYAYHFNAGLLALYLKDIAIKRGVNYVSDDVVSINLNQDGGILDLVTKNHDNIGGDLFIDCTGFKGLLINQTLKERFNYFSDSLLCDTALAMQIPKDIEVEGMNPYTTATALSSGWVWNIPLYGRDGTGYVYSSAFISNEDAEKELRAHLGPVSDNYNASLVKMRIGRNENAWVKNCVAIGLSNAFVEPLESTGIFFIQHGVEELVVNFPDKNFDPQLTKRYNSTIADCIDGVKDFLTLHYCASSRDDSAFWKATKYDIKVSEQLKMGLLEWKSQLPNSRNINQKFHGFEAYSYAVMLQGLGYIPETNLPVLNHLSSENALARFNEIKNSSAALCKTLPSQYEYLTYIRQAEETANLA